MFNFSKKSQKSKSKNEPEKEVKKLSKQQIKDVEYVAQKNGWDFETAKAEMKKAKKKYGITFRNYAEYKLYQYPENEQFAKLGKLIENKESFERRVEAVMSATGCSHSQAKNMIKDAKARLGISSKNYVRHRFYDIPIEEQEEVYAKLQAKKAAQKEKKNKKNEAFIHKVMAASGWDYDKAKQEMDNAKELCGAEYKDYASYEFWRLSPEKQKTYFTKGMANTLQKKYNVAVEKVNCFMNKNEFNEIFSDYLGRPWMNTQNMQFDEFAEKFTNCKAIYKPLSASCGAGIEVFEINEDNRQSIFDKISKLPAGVLEGYIVQHPAVSAFSKNSVNTIRMVTLFDGEEVNLLYAAFRMGGGDAVVDNFHNGGVLALIDVTNGEVVTDAIDLSGKFYAQHPATNMTIKGFVIPNWDKVVSMIKQAGKLVEGIGYIGWDIAITADNALLIEGNTAPAPNVLQLPYSKFDKGMGYVVERFL